MKAKLAERSLFQPTFTTLTADSPLTDLVTYWLEDIELEDRLSKTTRNLYERNMRTLVLPVLGKLTLRELGVARCDHFLKQLAKQSYNRAKQARVVLRLALGLAVRHEVLPRNPMDHVARLHRKPHIPDALTPAEVNAIRAVIAHWEAGRSISSPKPEASSAPSSKSCSALRPESAKCLPSDAATSTSPARPRRSGWRARSSVARVSRRSAKTIRRLRGRSGRSLCRPSPPRRSGVGWLIGEARTPTICCSNRARARP